MSIALTDLPVREIRLPDALARALKPTGRRLHMLEVQGLLHRLDHHFTSTRRLAEACGQMEITLLPWYKAQRVANAAGVRKIWCLLELLPRLDAISGDPKESGLWLICPHYGFAPSERGSHPWNRHTPAAVFHRDASRADEIIDCAVDDFKNGSAVHRDAIHSLGHELLGGGKIKLCTADTEAVRYGHAPRQKDAPYFHHRPRTDKTLAEKSGRA